MHAMLIRHVRREYDDISMRCVHCWHSLSAWIGIMHCVWSSHLLVIRWISVSAVSWWLLQQRIDGNSVSDLCAWYVQHGRRDSLLSLSSGHVRSIQRHRLSDLLQLRHRLLLSLEWHQCVFCLSARLLRWLVWIYGLYCVLSWISCIMECIHLVHGLCCWYIRRGPQ
jgi:hypothetical protein